MKTFNLLLLSSLILAGCGGSDKNPVGDDLDQIRVEGKTVTEMGPQKPVVLTKTVVVEKPTEYTKEESTIDDKFLVITPDPKMTFKEGQPSSYKIRARVLVPGVQIKLTASGLPPGATLTSAPNEKDLYVLSWTPVLYTVPSNEDIKIYDVKLSAQVASATDPAMAEKFKGLAREKEIVLFLSRTQQLPTELKISGLPSEVTEGQEPIPFTVTVKVPGMDDKAPQKPRLVVSYDGVSYTAGNDYLELDGSRYIIADLNKKDAEYTGNFQWKFSLLFDTKNISVQPQISKDGSVMPSADGTRARVSFKVYNGHGLSTPETLHQIKIRYNKKIFTPRFDFSGLAKKALEVSRGETIHLKFTAASPSANAQLNVTAKESTLPGSPTVACMASQKGPATQNCTLTWKVPCEAAAENLTGQIEMTALDSAGDPSTNTSDYSLQTKPAANEKKLCAAKKGKSL